MRIFESNRTKLFVGAERSSFAKKYSQIVVGYGAVDGAQLIEWSLPTP